MMYFTSCNLLSPCQHGFRSSHTCVTQLLQAVNDWSSWPWSLATLCMLYTWTCVLSIVSPTESYYLNFHHMANWKLLDLIENFLIDREPA